MANRPSFLQCASAHPCSFFLEDIPSYTSLPCSLGMLLLLLLLGSFLGTVLSMDSPSKERSVFCELSFVN